MALAADDNVRKAIIIYGFCSQISGSNKHPERPIPIKSKNLRLNSHDFPFFINESENHPEIFIKIPAVNGGAVVASPVAASDSPWTFIK